MHYSTPADSASISCSGSGARYRKNMRLKLVSWFILPTQPSLMLPSESSKLNAACSSVADCVLSLFFGAT